VQARKAGDDGDGGDGGEIRKERRGSDDGREKGAETG
jgi:hypothetical protein